MVRTLPGAGLYAGPSGRFEAGRVAPVRDQTGPQLEQAGSAMARSGGAVIDYADALQSQLDASAAMEADNALSDAYRDALYGQQGYMRTVGRQSVEAHGGVAESLGKRERDLAAGLGNERQREAFLRAAAQRRQSGLLVMDRHRAQQLTIYEIGQTSSRAETARQDAVTYWQDPDRAKRPAVDGVQGPPEPIDAGDVFWHQAVAETQRLAELKGLSPEEAQQMQRQATSEMATGRIAKLLRDGMVTQAEALFAQHESAGHFEPKDAERVGAVVKRAGIEDQAQRLALQLRSDDTPLHSQVAEADRLFRNNDLTVEQRDATVRRLEHMDTTQRTSEARHRDSLMKQAQTWAIQNRGNPSPQMDPLLLLEMQADPQLAAQFQLWTENGGLWLTTSEGNAKLSALQANPGSLRGMSWPIVADQHRAMLDDDDMKALSALYARDNQVEKAEHTQILTVNERIKEGAAQAGIIDRTGRASEFEKAEYHQFRAAVQERLRAYETVHGKKADEKAVQQAIDDVALDKVSLPDWVFDNEARAFPLSKEDRARAYVTVDGKPVRIASVPEADRIKIVDALLRNNKPVTEQTIVEMWLLRGGNRPAAAPTSTVEARRIGDFLR